MLSVKTACYIHKDFMYLLSENINNLQVAHSFWTPHVFQKDRQLDAALFESINLNAVGIFHNRSQQYKSKLCT